jgi:hypothetical protein
MKGESGYENIKDQSVVGELGGVREIITRKLTYGTTSDGMGLGRVERVKRKCGSNKNGIQLWAGTNMLKMLKKGIKKRERN